MAAMASALYLQSHGAPSHSAFTSSSSSPKLAQSRRIAVAFSNCTLRPCNSFKNLHFRHSSGNFSFTVLQRKRSCCVIQAQQSSIADSEHQAGARRNIEGNLIEKDDETSNTKEVEDTEQGKAYWTQICDKLIEDFMFEKPNTSDWRKFMAFSKTWNNIRPHFFERCRERADAENDLDMKQNLLLLSRKTKEVDADMPRHDELLNKIRENPSEINAIVAKRRKDFTVDFFEHLEAVCNTYHNNLEARDELARIGAQCVTAVDAYDNAYWTRICDKLIEVFMFEKPNTSDWRKLMAFSKTWNNIRPHFFERCRERADAENDLDMKQNLLRLSRKIKEVDADMQRHDELLNKIRENPSEINAIVAKRRKDFTVDFFEHLKTVCNTYHNNLEARDELARIGAQCATAVDAYDNSVGDYEALRLAQVKFDDIVNSPSLEAATKKIDNLAKQNQLDSSMMLLITKAWASTKESTMMKDEAKDIMYHLYMTARAALQQQVPKEIRIIKYLLSLEDPEERFTALTQAFQPGDEKQEMDLVSIKDFQPGDEKHGKDMLYTTPEELHKHMQTVLDAYYNKKPGTLIQEARKMMKPMVIQRLEVLKGVVEAEYM